MMVMIMVLMMQERAHATKSCVGPLLHEAVRAQREEKKQTNKNYKNNPPKKRNNRQRARKRGRAKHGKAVFRSVLSFLFCFF